MVEAIIRANSRVEKLPHLVEPREKREGLQVLLRIAKEARAYASFKSYAWACGQCLQWGAMRDGRCWPIVRLRDPARELTFAASASSANLRFGRRGLISATGQMRSQRFALVTGHLPICVFDPRIVCKRLARHDDVVVDVMRRAQISSHRARAALQLAGRRRPDGDYPPAPVGAFTSSGEAP